jgi:DNA-binding CsgD family transcriptional regulator
MLDKVEGMSDGCPFVKGVATPQPDRHNHVMGRERGEQVSPDLFSTAAVRDASTPPPPATADAKEPEPQRHVLPKNLRNAVKHLNDEELDLLHAATFEEMKRRGRFPPSIGAGSEQSSRRPLNLRTKRLPPTDKTSHRRQANILEVSLTLGQINAVRAAFKAGVTPARIARQFGISISNVRKALATDEAKR